MLLTGTRRRRAEEDGESVFVSMTDLTVSFLFIILILMAFFATQFRPEEMVPREAYEQLKYENETLRRERETPDPLADHLDAVSRTRDALLERLAERISHELPGIRVTVAKGDGVIRFRGDDLFGSERWRIDAGSTAERMARAVGDALVDTLPCYTVGDRSAFDTSCNDAFAVIETIQIEGHTDDDPLSASTQNREKMKDNYDLSARRGAETLRAISGYRQELKEFLNLRRQPVLSFAGYGATRPIEHGQAERAKAANRRIDIRFILHTPKSVPEVEEIRHRLTHNRPRLPQVVNE